VSQSPWLLVDGMDLVGNYRVDYEESRALLGPFTIDARGVASTSQETQPRVFGRHPNRATDEDRAAAIAPLTAMELGNSD
jgi:hypothetical protein